MKKENKMNYKVILIPSNDYDTIKEVDFKTEKEMDEWFTYHTDNPTIKDCQIIIEKA